MDSASPTGRYTSPYNDERIRRNVACTNCRNSKVRCRASQVSGQPCQRCAKLEISCVVDKSHKRITKRSKLEQLEQELKSIKQAVNPRLSTDGEVRPPRSPRASHAAYANTDLRGLAIAPSFAGALQHTPTSTSVTESATVSAAAAPSAETVGMATSATAPAPVVTARRPPKTTSSQSRTLGTMMVGGSDVDFYFDRFLECFHPFVPILRRKDPDQCYEACPTLFWVVIYISCRRYCRDEEFFTNVTEALSKDIWTLLSTPIMSLEETHALLLMCAYPLPAIRFVTDPSTTFAGIAMNICMLLGLHTGKGAHQEFCIGSRQNITCTDEEASSTWFLACILAQRSASSIGHPPPSIQLSDAAPRRALSSDPAWADLLAMFDIQKYLNRMHAAMAAHISGGAESVAEGIVTSWEDEFETLRPVLSRHDSEITRFMMVSAQQEIQAYYFTQPLDQQQQLASSSPPPINMIRAVRTAERVISTILALDSSPSTFLTHAPHWVFRSVIDAASVLVAALHSHMTPFLNVKAIAEAGGVTAAAAAAEGDGDLPSALVRRAHAAVLACSVREGDLPSRGAAIIEAFWSNREKMPKSDCLVRAWPNRLGAGTTFWCLRWFNQGLTKAKVQCQGLIRPGQPSQNQGTGADNAQISQPPQSVTPSMTDPFQEVDWTMFLDDFCWGGDEPVFMGLS